MIENNTWESMLKQLDIAIKRHAVDENPSAFPLSGFSIIEVTGNDRYSFLQNQITSDLEKNKTISQLSAWCNPKGKVIANFIVINTVTSYLLILKRDLKDFVQKRLSMYILRSEVIINDVSDLYFLLGLSNINKLRLNDSTILLKGNNIEFINKKYITQLPDLSRRILIIGNIELLDDTLLDLKDTVDFVDYSAWERLDILSKVPWINFENKEKYLPQMINLDKLNAVSFEKGCYTGQEVIARVHYRGKVKRSMELICSKRKLHHGDHLYLKNSEKKVGDILNSSSNQPDGDIFYLAIIESEKLNYDLFADPLSKYKIEIIKHS